MGFWIVLGFVVFFWMIKRWAKKIEKQEEEQERQRKRATDAREWEQSQNNPQNTVQKTPRSSYTSSSQSTHSVVRESTPTYASKSRVSGSKWKVQPARVFKDNYLSYSRLSMFEKCPRQFELIYLCGNPDVSGEAAEKGSVVHKIAELAAEEYVGQPTVEIYNDHTSDSLIEYYDDAVAEVNPKSNIRPLILKPLLDNFVESCDVYEDQIILENEKTIDTHIGDYPVKCIIDRVDQDDEGIKLIDYKTGKKQYVKNLQLEIYGTAHNVSEQSGNVRLEYQFLKDGTSKTWDATKSTFDRTKDTITRKAREIENTRTFVRKKTPLCNYCAVSHLCYS